MTWLDELKIGDKVFVKSIYSTRLATIKRITPTGQININESSVKFNRYGKEMAHQGWGHSYLSEWTQEEETELIRIADRKQILYKLSKFDYNILTDEELHQVLKICKAM